MHGPFQRRVRLTHWCAFRQDYLVPGSQLLKWDAAVKADGVKHIKAAQLDASACDPRVENLPIMIEMPVESGYPDIALDVASKKGVTVRHVLNAIHGALESPVDNHWKRGAPGAAKVERAASQRCKTRGEAYTGVPIVADLLLGNTTFGGCIIEHEGSKETVIAKFTA